MRETILQTIIAALQPEDFVLALWQGGSAAHGYTDEWSDLDVVGKETKTCRGDVY